MGIFIPISLMKKLSLWKIKKQTQIHTLSGSQVSPALSDFQLYFMHSGQAPQDLWSAQLIQARLVALGNVNTFFLMFDSA